ncbi:restriction endonuclease subunit S [Flavonifractor plautii]|uniref:restriction endonuclease subunit S n=1 Tax=Flavonifractor plautii TaxID=292800 RepID=UPI0034B62D8B
MEYVNLGDLIVAAKNNRCGDCDFPVLSITKNDGIVLQSEKFKKRIASKDTANYKIVHRGQLVQGIHIDEANFGIQEVVDIGIVSPAYKIWDIKRNAIVPKYLEVVLRSPRSIAYYASKFNGSIKRRERLSDKDFLQMRIPCPSVDEQIYAIEVLDKIIALIDSRKQQLLELDNLIKARFVEMFGDLAAPDCRWRTLHLYEACESADGIKCGPFGTQLSKDEYQSAGVAVWEIPQINNGFTSLPTHYLTNEKANQLSAYSLISGDIAMSRKGNVGKCAVFPKNFPDGIIHSDVLRIRVDHDRVLPLFMMYQLHFSRAVQYQIESVSSGAIMAGINVSKLKNIIVHVPPIQIQEQFTTFAEQIDKSKVVGLINGIMNGGVSSDSRPDGIETCPSEKCTK